MQINTLERKQPDSRYMDPSILQVLEDHLYVLKKDPDNTLLPVSNHLNYKYEGDFYGLLNELKVVPKYHYITMRINNLVNSTDYIGDKDFVIFPNVNEIDTIINVHTTQIT